MTHLRLKGLLLAVHPTTYGFGWVLFEGPQSPVDWGLAGKGRRDNAQLMHRFEQLLNKYEPRVLVLEEFESAVSKRASRIQRLCRAMIHLAAERGLETPVYSRQSVRACFASVGATTRHEIARCVAQHIDVFRWMLPKERKPWMSESPRQSLFDAAALAITYFAVTGAP